MQRANEDESKVLSKWQIIDNKGENDVAVQNAKKLLLQRENGFFQNEIARFDEFKTKYGLDNVDYDDNDGNDNDNENIINWSNTQYIRNYDADDADDIQRLDLQRQSQSPSMFDSSADDESTLPSTPQPLQSTFLQSATHRRSHSESSDITVLESPSPSSSPQQQQIPQLLPPKSLQPRPQPQRECPESGMPTNSQLHRKMDEIFAAFVAENERTRIEREQEVEQIKSLRNQLEAQTKLIAEQQQQPDARNALRQPPISEQTDLEFTLQKAIKKNKRPQR